MADEGPFDLLLVDGDIVVTDDLALVTDILTAVRQELATVLGMFRGEWFLNLDEGTPYFQEILGRRYDEADIARIFNTQILSVAGVASIDKMLLDFNAATRALAITWTVITTAGSTISDSTALQV